MGMSRGPYCQSCGVPMENPYDFGTNADGNLNHEFCAFCYQFGKFTEPDLTIQEMTDRVSDMVSHYMTLGDLEARGIVKATLPSLKRWQKGKEAAPE